MILKDEALQVSLAHVQIKNISKDGDRALHNSLSTACRYYEGGLGGSGSFGAKLKFSHSNLFSRYTLDTTVSGIIGSHNRSSTTPPDIDLAFVRVTLDFVDASCIPLHLSSLSTA